jgi:hypothetical protein
MWKIIALIVCVPLLASCAGMSVRAPIGVSTSAGTVTPPKNLFTELTKLDAANAEVSRQVATDLLKTWRLNSGFVRGALGPKFTELPAQVVVAMDELDKMALKTTWDDFDLGYSLGLRVRLLAATVTQALRLYAPDVLTYLPSLLVF